MATIKFILTFDVQANTLKFTDDTILGTGESIVGLVKITHTTSGTILYQHPDWAELTGWTSPDVDTANTILDVEDIACVTAGVNGAYSIEYKTILSSHSVSYPIETTIRTYTLAYTTPGVDITQTVECSLSSLTSRDVSTYAVGTVVPLTITRAHTITAPAGSGYTGTLGSTNEATRTVGGGNDVGTYLWTRTWQTDISSLLLYLFEPWGTVKPTIYLIDTVTGSAEVFAQCDQTICALSACYKNMLDRWNASLTSNFAYREDNRDKVIQVIAKWNELTWLERCGSSIETTVSELQVLLAGENCNCITASNDASIPITPWGYSSGTTTISDFVFHVMSADPTTPEGHNGDLWQNNLTWELFQKVAGAWVSKGVTQAPAADAPTALDQTLLTLLNDTTEYPTPASLSETAISWDFQLSNGYFPKVNDYMEFFYEIKLAQNQNGKTIKLKYDGTDVVTYFTDDLVNAENDRLFIYLKVVPVSSVKQHLTMEVKRSGNPGQLIIPAVIRSHESDLSSAVSVQLYGTNSVAAASDIICDSLIVNLHHRETDLIPGGIPLYDGVGLRSQAFTATEGQTEFTVTDFIPNDFYLPLINNVPQSQIVVTRSGYVFTYSPGLAAGDVLLIIN